MGGARRDRPGGRRTQEVTRRAHLQRAVTGAFPQSRPFPLRISSLRGPIVAHCMGPAPVHESASDRAPAGSSLSPGLPRPPPAQGRAVTPIKRGAQEIPEPPTIAHLQSARRPTPSCPACTVREARTGTFECATPSTTVPAGLAGPALPPPVLGLQRAHQHGHTCPGP